jgi:hypothetical protein
MMILETGMTMVPDPDALDMHDFDLSVTLGERTRRQLIRHFRGHIDAAIRGQGFDPVDAQLLEQDQLDAQAWRLAEAVIERVENALSESLQLGVIESPADHLADMVAEVRTEIWQEWSDNELFGVSFLLERAADAPLVIE